MLLSDVCLTSVSLRSVCLSRTWPNSRTERPRKTKIGRGIAHVTRDSDTTFKVKGKLVADVLNSQHAGTGALWRINTKMLSTCRGRRHTVSPCAQLVVKWVSLIKSRALRTDSSRPPSRRISAEFAEK